MKKRYSFFAVAVAAAFAISFTACGDDSSSGSSNNTIYSKEDLEEESCTEDNQGDIIHVEDEDADYTCNGEEWESTLESSSSVAAPKSSAAKECDEDVEDCDEDDGDDEDEVSSSSEEEEDSSSSEEEESSSSKQSSKSSSSKAGKSSTSEESGKSSSSEVEVIGGSSSSSEPAVVSGSSSSEVSGKSSSSLGSYEMVVMDASSNSGVTKLYYNKSAYFTVPGMADCEYHFDDEDNLTIAENPVPGEDDNCPMTLKNTNSTSESVEVTISVVDADKVITPGSEYADAVAEELPKSVTLTLCGKTNCRATAYSFLDTYVKWTSETAARSTSAFPNELNLNSYLSKVLKALSENGYTSTETTYEYTKIDGPIITTITLTMVQHPTDGYVVLYTINLAFKGGKVTGL